MSYYFYILKIGADVMYFMEIMNLIANDESIPLEVKLDVSKRIINYCEAGGCESDPYIKRQLTYLKEVKENAKQNR